MSLFDFYVIKSTCEIIVIFKFFKVVCLFVNELLDLCTCVMSHFCDYIKIMIITMYMIFLSIVVQQNVFMYVLICQNKI